MKKLSIILCLSILCAAYISFTSDGNKPYPLPPNKQRTGDAEKGYQYLITGDYLRSGIPYKMYTMAFGKDSANLLHRDSLNTFIPYDYTAIKAPNGEQVVTPNCLRCHAQVFDDKLYVGLGNASAEFSDSKMISQGSAGLYTMLSMSGGKSFEAAKNFLIVTKALGPHMQTEVRGVNAADRLASVLAAHRDPITFAWSDKPLLDIPGEVIPTDVPAWWLLKKKNAMFYNGFGRGDFARFLMASNLLTVADTSEAREVFAHFTDVLSYIYSTEAPRYPRLINDRLAAQGKSLFNKTCSGCHGTYGKDGKYPNLLIPADIIGTDSALYSSNYSSPQFVDWFNKSWFTKGEHSAQLVPYKGYIAPPLDGIWITAPYLHNGSVPTLEGVLNSKERPAYWSRNFSKPEYDYTSVGWKHAVAKDDTKGSYNTTIKGYGNYGHYFGDQLSDNERKAVIEYLKTL